MSYLQLFIVSIARRGTTPFNRPQRRILTLKYWDTVLYFINNSGQDRWINFTPNSGWDGVDDQPIANGEHKNIDLYGKGPVGDRGRGWQGNFRSHLPGRDRFDANLVWGEITLRGDFGLTYFDVSVVPNPNAQEGVHFMYPLYDHDTSKISGCEHFPCPGAYVNADDKQTKVTADPDIIVELRAPA